MARPSPLNSPEKLAQVLELIGNGWTEAEIAGRLDTSLRSITRLTKEGRIPGFSAACQRAAELHDEQGPKARKDLRDLIDLWRNAEIEGQEPRPRVDPQVMGPQEPLPAGLPLVADLPPPRHRKLQCRRKKLPDPNTILILCYDIFRDQNESPRMRAECLRVLQDELLVGKRSRRSGEGGHPEDDRVPGDRERGLTLDTIEKLRNRVIGPKPKSKSKSKSAAG